jgi:hypothetical protein
VKPTGVWSSSHEATKLQPNNSRREFFRTLKSKNDTDKEPSLESSNPDRRKGEDLKAQGYSLDESS